MASSKRLLAVSGLAAIALLSVACGDGDTPQLDVTLAVDLPDSVPLGEPLDFGYAWASATDFTAPSDDYQVFVHIRDPLGNILFQDDHYPTEPTSQWTASDQLAYRRWFYMPEDTAVEYFDVYVGLFSQGVRAEIRNADGEWTDEILARRIEVRADDMSGIPVYLDGWHPAEEVAAEEPAEWQWDEPTKWRWAMGTSKVVFTNPQRDAVLHFRGHGPFDEMGPQSVVIKIGEQEVARHEIVSADNFLVRLDIPASAMGDNEWVELTFETTPVLIPKELNPDSVDERELGVQVFSLYLSSTS